MTTSMTFTCTQAHVAFKFIKSNSEFKNLDIFDNFYQKDK